jgi:hypothetical protein
MGKIYSKAFETLTFLGRADNALRELLDVYRKDELNLMSLIKSEEKNEVLRNQAFPIVETDLLRSQASPRQVAFVQLCQNSWFRRGWVVQESILSKILYFVLGEYRLEFSDFMNFLTYWNFVHVRTALDSSSPKYALARLNLSPIENF